jgi:hypothetical protein
LKGLPRTSILALFINYSSKIFITSVPGANVIKLIRNKLELKPFQPSPMPTKRVKHLKDDSLRWITQGLEGL